MGAPDTESADRVSGTAPSPCPESGARAGGSGGARGGLVEAPVHLAPIRRQMRELAQEICPLIGFLDDLHRGHTLHEWAWLFDELADRAEVIQSHATALKHMSDVMWERTYRAGREEDP
jgi:hypothetical protein